MPESVVDAANTTPATEPFSKTNGPPEFPGRTFVWSSYTCRRTIDRP